MRYCIITLFVTILFTLSACHTQRLVENINDAEKLKTHKNEFIGHPLNKVLSQIKPKIRFVHGNPENKSGHVTGGTRLIFYFVSREVGRERTGKNDPPTHITINFRLESENNRKPLPKEGLAKWTKKESKEYGDMIVQNIYVSGKN